MARLFYFDTGTHEWTDTDSFEFVIVRTDLLTTVRNQRDLYFRVPSAGAGLGELHVGVFATLAEANAFDYFSGGAGDPVDFLGESAWRNANGVLAYASGVTWPSAPQSLELTNVAANAPDLSGLVIQIDGDGSAPITDHNMVVGWMAAPEVLVRQKLRATLEAYMGSGQALADFSTVRLEFGPSGFVPAGRAPNMVGVFTEAEGEDAAAGYVAINVNFTIAVGCVRKGAQDALDDCSTYAGSVRSILQTESTLDGVALETVVPSVAAPSIEDSGGKEMYAVARVNGFARFPTLTREVV